MNWHSFTYVYQTWEALSRVHEALEAKGPRFPIAFKELPPLKKINEMPTERERNLVYDTLVKEIQTSTQSTLLVDIETANLGKFLETLNNMKVMGDYFMGLIVNLVIIQFVVFWSLTLQLMCFQYG